MQAATITSDFVLPADGFAGAGLDGPEVFGGSDSEANPSRPSAPSLRIGTTLGPAAPSVLLSSLVPDGQRFGFALLDIGVLARDVNATPCHNDNLEIRPNPAWKASITQTI